MPLDAALPGLLEKLYAAIGTTDRWEPFLAELRTVLRGTGVSLVAQDLPQQRGTCAIKAETAPAAVSRYLIEASPDRLAGLSIQSDRRSRFYEEDAALLESLLPHLRRAIQLHRRLGLARARGLATGAALDLVTHAVILVDAHARVTLANRAAAELVQERDGLTAERGELRAANARCTEALRRAIAAAARAGDASVAESAGLVTLDRPSGRPRFWAFVSRIVPASALLSNDPSVAMVLVTNPERIALPSGPQLQALFGLTQAEIRFALALLGGETLSQVADELGVSRNTGRSHLRQLFAKTFTSRQAELIRLLLAVAVPIREITITSAHSGTDRANGAR